MPKKRIHINESQLYRLVERVISENFANKIDLDMDTSFKTASVIYNCYGDNPGPMSPINGFNEKIAGELLSSLDWTSDGRTDYMYGIMMAEVEGTADDGNLCDVQVEAEICVDPYRKSIARWTRVEVEHSSVWDGKSDAYERIPRAEVVIDKKGIGKALDNAIGGFVKKGGLDEVYDIEESEPWAQIRQENESIARRVTESVMRKLREEADPFEHINRAWDGIFQSWKEGLFDGMGFDKYLQWKTNGRTNLPPITRNETYDMLDAVSDKLEDLWSDGQGDSELANQLAHIEGDLIDIVQLI